MAQGTWRQNSLKTLQSKLGGPVTSTVLIVGALLVVLGAVLQSGVWAGMLGIIGGLLIFVSVTFRILLVVYRLI